MFQVAVFPAALMTGFGRWQTGFEFFAQHFAGFSGIFGSYLRVAYYHLTLESVGHDCHIAIGSFFANRRSSMGDRVGIGAYCVLGQVSLGDGTIMATGVQIISGSRQHLRDESGHLTDVGRSFDRINIGKECWLGAGAIIMADLGDMVTVALGSVVFRDVPAGAVVAGNPARIIPRSVQRDNRSTSLERSKASPAG
jgi:virginiamycin A acetyltransferase